MSVKSSIHSRYADCLQIARRLRLTDEGNGLSQNALAYYCMLIDTVIAIQQPASAPVFSSNEFSTKMLESPQLFRPTYRALLNGQTPPANVTGRQDALVLLTALLSDAVHIRRAHASIKVVYVDEEPFRPLTAETQHKAMISGIVAACTRWMERFASHAGDDILALYYFVRLYLATPAMDELVSLARGGIMSGKLTISREAVQLAWSVLEYAKKAVLSEIDASYVWLAVALYHSALVVWYELRSNIVDGDCGSIQSVFMPLEMFKTELAKMPWPFCVNAVSRIDALVANGVPSKPA